MINDRLCVAHPISVLNILMTLFFLMATQTVNAATVVEFYNTNLDNYFITADANEAADIDNGSAGPGWSRTGNTFNSGGSTPVCRFYGSQSPGPNSHFYTADASECADLKQLQATTPATEKRWNFESLDFLTTVPVNGICTAGTTPVYRAYNNGWIRGVDSNHRITTSLTAIQQVVARGWNNEGVVMCAPVSTRFTKVDAFGNKTPDSTTNWSCVLDNTNGLLWEVKTNDGGLRDQSWVYTAYETTGTNENGVCDATKSCNQSYFRDAVNVVGLCGYKDWRLARVTELESLQNSSRPQAPYIDTQYFPFTKSGRYWATNIYLSAANQSVWWVDFATIYSASTRFKDIQHHVRLVRP
jgi:hypothetical protein